MKPKNLVFALLVAGTVGAYAEEDLTPEILWPDPVKGALLYGMSDNGLWGVACGSPGDGGSSDFTGASLYNLSGYPVEIIDLKQGAAFCAAFDVTDDGKMVAGSYNTKPAVCRLEDGNWTWHELPVPDREITISNPETGYSRTYRINAGEVSKITPDGRYGMGMVGSNETVNISIGMMWDLTTMEMIEIPALRNASYLMQITADGRYVLAQSGGYVLYDMQTGESKQIRGLGLSIYVQSLSTDGHYISGVYTGNDGEAYAAYYDVWNDKLTVIDGDGYADAAAWTTTNDGVPLIGRPYLTPYADAYVWHDDYMYSLEDLLKQGYGIDLESHGITNTGKPGLVSADGRTMSFITAARNCYVLRLKEDIRDALDRIDLLKDRTVTPAEGAVMTALGEVRIRFAHPMEGSPMAYARIGLLDSEGNVVATPLSNGGVTISGNEVSIAFRTKTLNPGETYTLLIPEGQFWIKGREKNSNEEIRIQYTGRENIPVKPLEILPAPGSSLSSLSLTENPIVVTFDTKIRINEPLIGKRPVATVFIDEEEQPVAEAILDTDVATGTKLVIYPSSAIPLYKGSTYRIEVPEGVVTDLSGYGASDALSISYEGSYVPQLGDEKYLFRSTCDSYNNFLFYEGDHGTPVSEYLGMGFNADLTPWVVVRESEASTDQAFGSHSVYTDGRQADDWVTTRQLLIPETGETYLSFDSQSYRRDKQDYLKVYVYEHIGILNSLSESTISDIRENGDLVYNELQDPGASEDYLAGDWRHNVINLTKYAGKSIYICFVNDNRNQSMVIIDNIEVFKDMNSFITLRNNTNVVGNDNVKIWGMLSVVSETKEFSSVSMTLKDKEGNTVSSIKEDGLNLKEGDAYNFSFPESLPLVAGEENAFSIEYSLDDAESKYEGIIRALTFQPEKRVVVEEFTGSDCQFCPGGIIMMERLVDLYDDRIIPVALHCYNGTDPKGANVMGYWQFTGMTGAPQARINRGEISSPLFQIPGGYVDTAADIPGNDGSVKLWKDYVVEEFVEPALMEVSLIPEEAGDNEFAFTASVRSAINLENTNIRVFGVLLEDNLIDYQVNAYANIEDPIFGEWGHGGLYGSSTAIFNFSNVARQAWGTSYNGTAGLLPNSISTSWEYPVEIRMDKPANVVNPTNCKMVVMLIDDASGKVINSAVSKSMSKVKGVEENALLEIRAENGNILVNAPGPVNVRLYNAAGLLLKETEGNGNVILSTEGYSGLLIVEARTASGSTYRKFMMR